VVDKNGLVCKFISLYKEMKFEQIQAKMRHSRKNTLISKNLEEKQHFNNYLTSNYKRNIDSNKKNISLKLLKSINKKKNRI
jgi:hypothetical protein